MTIINPNSIAGITSVTAEAGVMNFYKSDGTLAGLQLNGVNFNTTSGVSTFSNLYVGGVLTYEDVRNVDSVGIVTARAGIKVPDDQRIRLGAANDLDIYHTTSGTSWIRHGNTSEYFVIEGDQMDFRSYTNSHYRVRMGTAVELRHNNIERLKTSSTGVTVTGDITISDKIIHAGDTNTAIRFPSADTISAETGGSEWIRIDSGGRILIGNTSSQEVYGTNKFQIQGTSATTSGMSLLRHGGSPYLALGSTGGSSVGAVNAVADDARLGQLTFVGADGTDVNTHAASIAAYVDGSVSSNTVPGRLVFKTSSGASEVERLRIKSTGEIHISDRNSATAGEHILQGGSFGIRMEDTGGYNRWNIERNYGGWQSVPLVHLSAQGRVGINTVSPQGALDVWGGLYLTSQGSGSGSGLWWSDPDNKSELFSALMETDNTFRFKTAGGAWKDTIYINSNGRIGIGTDAPATSDINGSVDIVTDIASNSPCQFRVLNKRAVYGGGVQVKNTNARGGVEFLSAAGTNVGAFYHSTGGWTWDKELQLVGSNAKLRIGTTSGSYLLNVDTGDGTDGHIIASFNGEESSNHAGLNIAHYLCGSDDNRTGLYWEHQNVSNQRMWMGDDLRLYLKNSNPTESTAQGRYIMTVDGGTADFPDGTSYDNAAKSALEIKRHCPNMQTGNYWIYDYNGVPRQIRCDMEIDGGGWMLWNDYNTSSTSMNEALGGSSTSPHSGLGRGNYGNYAYYQVLIRASKIDDGDREALHTIVQLDHNGNLFRKYDYGEEFFLEEVGDPFNPATSQYFTAGTGEFIKMDGAYQPQLGASGWETFSGGGWQQVWIRELDTRLAPGDHRSYAMHERVFCFNDNGVPMWRNADSTGILPYWTDIRGNDNMADGSGLNSSGTQTDNMQDTGRTLYMNNGNNGNALHGRLHGVFLGEFEVAFRLSAWWGWAVGNMNSGIGVQESISDGQAWPYYANTNYGYAAFGLMNNSSNNLWYPNHFYNGDTSQTVGNSGSGYSGGNSGWNIMWRTGDGTIKVRRQDNTHGTYTYGKFVGPLVFGNGYQSPAFTEMGVCWDKPWNTNGSCMR